MYMDSLTGKVAFITGGASGIGLGMARAFVNEGMKVVIADIWQEHLDDALAGFEEAGQGDQVHTIRLDVSDRPAYERAAAETLERFGKLHVLCNNAGLGAGMRLKTTTYQDWDWAMGGDDRRDGERHRQLPAEDDRARRGRAHRQHLLDVGGAAAGDDGRGDLHHRQGGRGRHAGAGAPRPGRGPDRLLDPDPGPVQSNIFKIGQTRPRPLRQSRGRRPARRPMDPNAGRNPLWMDPDRVGEMVVEGVRKNALYIFTHSMFREGMQEKFQKMLDALPAEPDSEELKAGLGMFLHNPIYAPGDDAK
ncbi:MAG: SDR family NAD(P)-dependent oxidoreductase [Caulobacteraceae bacterium]